MGIVLLSAALVLATASAEEHVPMFVGEVKVMKIGDIDRVAVGNGDVISTSALDNGQLLVLAEEAGLSTMHVWMTDGAELRFLVEVTDEPANRQDLAELQAMLQVALPSVNASQVGRKIVMNGTIDAEEEPIIATIKEKFTETVDLVRRNTPVLNPDDNKMVLMDVRITEFNTNQLDDLGVSWTNPIPGPSAGFAYDPVGNRTFRANNPVADDSFDALPLRVQSPAGYFGIASAISSRLNFLVNSGDAVVLAQPRLVARSGGVATFLSGGEVPVITSSVNGINVEYKEFGIRLKVSPVVDREDNILAAVETEVSSIDPSSSVQGIPGFASRKTAADVSLKQDDTLVLSGLMNQETSKDVDRLAGLSNIPVLGALFRSKTFRNRQSELVIFVTPTIIDAESERNKQELGRHETMKSGFSSHVPDEEYELLD